MVRNQSRSQAPYDVLVTGSAGHLGTALMLRLPTLGFKPLGVDIQPSEHTHMVGSISDRDFISGIISGNSSIKHILHSATLHKPHVESHTQQQFIDTNITGTLVLLEAAKTLKDLRSFVFISTTSAFGDALSPKPGLPAAWIDETVMPIPKNIYGVTKLAAEELCSLAHRLSKLPVIVLRVARFFPEEDDDPDRRTAMGDDNLKLIELACRRCDIADIVSACHCAMKKAVEIGWGRYIISAPPPFLNEPETLKLLNQDSQVVFKRAVPATEKVFQQVGWKYLQRVDRVYDSSKAIQELGWQPYLTFGRAVQLLGQGDDWRSNLTRQIGKKGYHPVSTGVYTQR